MYGEKNDVNTSRRFLGFIFVKMQYMTTKTWHTKAPQYVLSDEISRIFHAFGFPWVYSIYLPCKHAKTGPVLARCCQHRPSTGPVLACAWVPCKHDKVGLQLAYMYWSDNGSIGPEQAQFWQQVGGSYHNQLITIAKECFLQLTYLSLHIDWWPIKFLKSNAIWHLLWQHKIYRFTKNGPEDLQTVPILRQMFSEADATLITCEE